MTSNELERLRCENETLRERERRCAAELAAANHALESFSYSVSHDLRAPLRSIACLIQIMREDYVDRLDEEGREVLDVISEGCGRLEERFTALLAFARAVRQPMDVLEVNMTTVARDAFADAVAVNGGAAPDLEMSPLPACNGDVTLLREVWSHLFINALKYSARHPQPRVKVSGRVEKGECVYQVVDNGVGFDMEQAHKLFGVFQRLHKADDFPGAGVGLAIVDRIVKRHGGRIHARATPDAGACFEFALPATEANRDNTAFDQNDQRLLNCR